MVTLLKRIYLRTGHIFLVKDVLALTDNTISFVSDKNENETLKLNDIEKTIWKKEVRA